MAQHEAAVTSHPTRQQLIRQQLILSTRGTAMAALLLCILGAAWGCDREPGILVNIAAWPDAIEQIRVRTGIDGTVGTDFYLNKGQTRFVVRVPVGSQGTVQVDAAGLDRQGCKRAVGSLAEPVPDNLSRVVERTLELQVLPESVCGQEPVNLPVILIDTAGLPVGVKRIRVRWSLGGTTKPDMFLGPIPSQFNLPLPAGSLGSVHLDAVAIDAGDCKVATASLDVMVPGSPSYFANVTLSFAPSSPTCMFAAASDFSTGTRPNSVAIGDFNRDQKLDLAIANEGDTTVSVLLGNGLGGFGAATNIPVGTAPFAVIVGDFNGDQKPDLAVANYTSNNVSVLLGNGMGGFGGATNFPVGAAPTSVVVGDFNGDQKPDLAVANAAGFNVSVLQGNGLGGFGTATNFPVGRNPYSVVAGDFNGDQKLDLAIANDGSNDVSVLLGNGLGGFGTATNFPVGTRPESVVVGDFNGDKKIDLAVANYGSDNVSVLLGNGLGGFAAANFAAGTQPTAIAVADFDGDMMLDLAVSNWEPGSLRVLMGNGKGSFAATTTNFPVGIHPISVAMGNFNEDQKPDLAIANWDSQSVSVLMNQF